MKTSSIITTTLLSLTSAAITPGPAINSTFPKFTTQVNPAGANLGAGAKALNSVLPVYSNVSGTLTTTAGPIRGYRNQLYAFPTQSLVKATAATTTTLGTIAAHTATRTFYQTSTVLIGTGYGTGNDGKFVTGEQANGSTWVVCLTTTTTIVCAGGVMSDGGATPVLGAYAGRVMMKAGNEDTTTA